MLLFAELDQVFWHTICQNNHYQWAKVSGLLQSKVDKNIIRRNLALLCFFNTSVGLFSQTMCVLLFFLHNSAKFEFSPRTCWSQFWLLAFRRRCYSYFESHGPVRLLSIIQQFLLFSLSCYKWRPCYRTPEQVGPQQSDWCFDLYLGLRCIDRN